MVLTTWSAATAHCMLEAVGLIPHTSAATDDGCCQSTDDCSADACDVVEDENYSAPTDDLAAPAPHLFVERCLQCLWDASLALANEPPLDDSHERAQHAPSTLGETLRVAHTVVFRL
ncbi:hypothetical protein [Actomonas aquatica]|uniref:Uncharacterized protein n=1 Tax=Actomonas aquatica TaxID=2866162 RepID=A0ABZ1CBE9_9BACT|nr:hypothetical protein [Opitutus sp. WL0086]WRQ88909.1 hypothetical protein K1X11_005790 [Opitutus sp. WL0086]